MRHPGTTRSGTVALGVVAAICWAGLSAAPAHAAASCADLDRPTWHVVNPSTGSSLLTPWSQEADNAASYGWTEIEGTPFKASTGPADELVAVHRLYDRDTRDFQWQLAGSAAKESAEAAGYADQGVNFFASRSAIAGCTVAVSSLTKGGHHQYALPGEVAALVAQGWTQAGTTFHAAPSTPVVEPAPVPPPPPAGTDTTFSFAVMPDTQNEVGPTDQRMPARVSWLVDNKKALDLRWVLHSGDVHNWDTPDHAQFAAMSQRLEPLTAAGLPFVAAAGNHDTGAVCPGGSACPGADTSVTVRDTSTWNAYYPPSRMGLQGVFEAGHSENGWRTFAAGGVDWLVLNLELWPRTSVITWAKNVVATHPDHNVIVLTHSFLEGSGEVSTSNGGYGANSPATLWAALDDYPNVVMTFSGHVGQVANTSLTARDGHKVATFLEAMHAPTTNPVRIVTVDTAAGSIRTEVRSNFDRALPAGEQDVIRVYPYTATVTGMRWVR